MTAYVVVHATVKNAEKLAEYGAAAAPTVASFGGEFVCRGASEVLAGANPHGVMVILKFPDRATATAWYNSPAYQAAIPARTEGMDSVFILGGE